jgi:hypothetical protein
MEDSPAHDVEVQVKHRLPGLGSVIDHHPVAPRFDAALAGELRRDRQQVAEELFLLWRKILQRDEMLPGNHQQVDGGLRVNVLDSKAGVIFVNESGGNLPFEDAAEDAVVHPVSVYPYDEGFQGKPLANQSARQLAGVEFRGLAADDQAVEDAVWLFHALH